MRRNRVRTWLFAQAINLLCETRIWDRFPHRWRMAIWHRYSPSMRDQRGSGS